MIDSILERLNLKHCQKKMRIEGRTCIKLNGTNGTNSSEWVEVYIHPLNIKSGKDGLPISFSLLFLHIQLIPGVPIIRAT